ncbi:hypothetical protein FB567DRAFT_543054 [Paraphoma chrysanthemicola]|uniref:Uncharacterized protein n=1 Tax=Paraphoma chrysanthemicola TaxID=798071 RepID=A0A8K0RJZ3_9PLEO|nr:hypothetical protein FB567DRAFT_543054 [Paraphoma chrysanthemicola]
MSSFSILPEWSHDEQRNQCKSYIEANLVKCGLEKEAVSILPITAIKELATYSNIILVIAKDPGLSALDERGRHNYAKNIHEYCPRLFVACMYAETNMPLLCNMWNLSAPDHKLPLAAKLTIEPELKEVYKKFFNIQDIFCAPVFKLGNYNQGVAKKCMAPCMQISGPDELGQFTMSFHPAHIVEHQGDDPGSYTGKSDFQCVKYTSREAAQMYTERWSRGKFGFMCEGEYFFLYE